MRLSRLAVLLCLLFLPLAQGCSKETPAEHAANVYAANEMAAAPVNANLPDFSLLPDKLAQADHLMTLSVTLHFSSQAWGILQLILLLSFGGFAWMRDRAIALSPNLWAQSYAFTLLYMVTHTVLSLPFSLYGHHLSLAYGFSVQSWGSWALDLIKGLALNWLLYGLLAVALFRLIGKLPRLWWLGFWAVCLPIALGIAYINPILIDPMFNQFEPLALHHPDLSAKLEHMGVPPERQFLMKASAKTTLPNAYVAGFAGSKRVVVWDTSLSPGQRIQPGVLWMVGHECGHYVLNHVRNGILMALLMLPIAFYLAYRFLNAVLRRFGPRWRIPSPQDWAALAVLMLAYALINDIQEPFSNTISRNVEHNADIYGMEAVHGLVPDPQAAMKDEITADGLRGLNDPNPAPWIEVLMFNHPATGRRAAFGKAYNPWADGVGPKYFKK